MKLLILGGTVFLGRHHVEALLAQGHDVTLFVGNGIRAMGVIAPSHCLKGLPLARVNQR